MAIVALVVCAVFFQIVCCFASALLFFACAQIRTLGQLTFGHPDDPSRNESASCTAQLVTRQEWFARMMEEEKATPEERLRKTSKTLKPRRTLKY